MTQVDRGRHLAVPFLLEHISAGLTTIYPFPGEPPVDLLIEGAIPRLTLRTLRRDAAALPSNPLKNIYLGVEGTADGRRLIVRIEGQPLMLDGHAMLCVIADRIQIDGLEPARAIADTLRQWQEVLAARSRLSTEAEIGLFGELLLLEALVKTSGSGSLRSWRGTADEEHDFGFADLDVEVKTTSGEHRRHWISSLTQLMPTTGRPLGLMSLQITRGGSAGRTLPRLMTDVRALVDDREFDEKLVDFGWDPGTSDLFGDRWLPRTEPAFFLLDPSFPAITPLALAAAVPGAGHITDVRYRLTLDDRATDESPVDTLNNALKHIATEARTNAF